jgi:F-type H+/Na+-transporting ATPase subunit alpha
MIREFL